MTAEPLADALLANPGATLSDLLTGRHLLGAMALAERADILHDVLQRASSKRRDALARAIDGALLDWMLQRLLWTDDEVAQYGARAYAGQYRDALSILAVLPLPTCAATVLDDPAPWDGRFRAMRGPDDIDLLGRFDVALAQHQRDGTLVRRWKRRCDEAAWGGPRWQDDLANAMLGLRKVPESPRPERLATTALVRFAALAIARETAVPAMRGALRTHADVLLVCHTLRPGAWRAAWAAALDALDEPLERHRRAVYEDWLVPAVPGAYLPDEFRAD